MKTPIHITPSRASKSAIRGVEKLGGTVFCKYYNPLALRDCVKGRTDRIQAAPVRQTDIGAHTHSLILARTHLFSQSGTHNGRTGAISRHRLSGKCLSSRSDGRSCQNSFARTGSRVTRRPRSRYVPRCSPYLHHIVCPLLYFSQSVPPCGRARYSCCESENVPSLRSAYLEICCDCVNDSVASRSVIAMDSETRIESLLLRVICFCSCLNPQSETCSVTRSAPCFCACPDFC